MENSERVDKTDKVMFNIVNRIEGKKILDIDILYIYEAENRSFIHMSKCFTFQDRAEIEMNYSKYENFRLLSSINIKEFLFGLITSISNLDKYSTEIDCMFNKRLYNIEDELIKSFSSYVRYLQLGYDVSAAIKLTLCILHDINKPEAVDVHDVLRLFASSSMTGDYNFKGLINTCEKDIIKLLKRMKNDVGKNESTFDPFIFSVLKEILNLATSSEICLEDKIMSNIFMYIESGIIDEIAQVKRDNKLESKVEQFFSNDDFCSTESELGLMHYLANSSNYIKRIIRKAELSVFDVNDFSFSGGISILPYVPDGFNRSDIQFIIHLMLNHFYTDMNKILYRFKDNQQLTDAKIQLYISYQLSKKFGFEKKEYHNMAIVFNALLALCKDLENTLQTNMNNVIDNIIHLKNFESSKISIMNELFNENTKVEHELTKYKENLKDYELEITKKAEKKAYLDAKKSVDLEVSSYKEEIKYLNNEIKQLKAAADKDNSSKIEKIEETYSKKETINLNTLNAVFVGDPNFDDSLLKQVFNDVVKVNGYAASTLHNPLVLMDRCDVLIYQSKYMKHVSAEFVKQANELGKPIVYIENCNPGLVLSEVYKYFYTIN